MPDVVLLKQYEHDLANKLREIADNDPKPSFNEWAIYAVEQHAELRKWTATCWPTKQELRHAADAIDMYTIQRVANKLSQ